MQGVFKVLRMRDVRVWILRRSQYHSLHPLVPRETEEFFKPPAAHCANDRTSERNKILSGIKVGD